ncbi:MAG: hypothetical protein IJF68_00595 [Opitutales bacterium]|nr:hypothetical protein [Opitutales bacterium]
MGFILGFAYLRRIAKQSAIILGVVRVPASGTSVRLRRKKITSSKAQHSARAIPAKQFEEP